MGHRTPFHLATPMLLVLALALLAGCGGGAPVAPDGKPATASVRPGPSRPADPPAGPGSMAPYLLASGRDILMTWTEPVPGSDPLRHRVRFARMDPATEAWSAPSTIAEGEDFFVNWADFPVLARSADGALFATWLQMSAEKTYAYDVLLARSDDRGATWRRLGPLHDDRTPTEHGFVSMVPEGDGVRAFWLDGRGMAGAEGAGHGSMSLRTALVGTQVGPGELLDDRTCECCQTTAVSTELGPLVAYRDRSRGEIRDIQLVAWTGAGWSAPVLLHEDEYEVPGCPVNGPAMDAAGEQVVVAWHTASDNEPRVLAAFSGDGGRGFGAPVLIDGENPPGRVDVALLPGRDAAVTWIGTQDDGAVIRARRVAPKGKLGPPVELARTSASRASGFPRIAVMDQRLYVGWTETGETRRVRVTSAPLPPGEPGEEAAGAGGKAAARGWDRKTGSSAPAFTASRLDGSPWDLSEARGKVTLLNLWATWCAPCRKEMPALAALHRSRTGEGFQVVGLSVDTPEMAGEVRSLAEKEEIGYPLVLDAEGKATGVFGVSSLPASFLFDREGVLVWQSRGVVDPHDPDLRAALEKALAS